MKLTKLLLQGYRRFLEPTELRTRGKLTAVIGPNEAGKTSLLRALEGMNPQAGPIQPGEVSMRASGASAETTAVFQAEPGDGLPEDRTFLLRRSAAGAADWSDVGKERGALEKLRPQFLMFDRTHRDLPDAVTIQSLAGTNSADKLPPAWRNLCLACGFRPEQMAADLKGVHSHSTSEDYWNEALAAFFAPRWKAQSAALPRLRIDGQVVHLQWRRGKENTPASWGSDGLRTFLALNIFLEAQRARGDRPVILLIDELEQSLHYGAQAEAVNMWHAQSLVKQVIYTTHSAGCLPRDVGRGVVAIEATGDNESIVRNAIWDSSTIGGKAPDFGVWPLLLALGAGTLGFLAVRRPVFVEGFTDLLYLPAALRWASGEEELGIDFYPGLAHACSAHEPEIKQRGRGSAYLTDGDAKVLRKRLQREFRVPKTRIFEGPYWTVEELLDRSVFLDVASKAHNVPVLDSEILDGKRIDTLRHRLGQSPAKERMAYLALDLADDGTQIWDESSKESLQKLLQNLRHALGIR
jgi:hypothetical protein